MPDYLAAAKNARSPEARRKFTRLHREQKLRDQINTCTLCPLHETRNNAVPWSGPTDADLLIVGEAPGANEDKTGEPFRGAAGRLLNGVLKGVGLERDEVMVMNTICCRPPRNRRPAEIEVLACGKNRTDQLKISKARVGILAGLAAYETITGKANQKMGNVQGVPFWLDGRVWIPTYHPAYILRNRSMKFALDAALEKARGLLEGKIRYPVINASDSGRIAGTPRQQKKWIRAALERQGWVQVYSERLGARMLVKVDDDVEVPDHANSAVHYTLAELAKMGEMGAGERMSTDDLVSIHLIKAELGGYVLS